MSARKVFDLDGEPASTEEPDKGPHEPASVDVDRDTNDSPTIHRRPKRRSECLLGGWNESRFCLFVGCRHHLALVRIQKDQKVVLQSTPLDELAETCALDVADEGARGAGEIAELLGVSSKTVNDLLNSAMAKMRRRIEQS